MSKRRFRVSYAPDADIEGGIMDGRSIEAYDPRDAAESYLREHHADWDCCRELELAVQDSESLQVTYWSVSAETTWVYSGRRLPDKAVTTD